MTRHQDRRVGLPRVTVEAIEATTPCPTCKSQPGERCTVARIVTHPRNGSPCPPHGGRIRAWHDLGMPVGVRR